jgi:hypothetical protein
MGCQSGTSTTNVKIRVVLITRSTRPLLVGATQAFLVQHAEVNAQKTTRVKYAMATGYAILSQDFVIVRGALLVENVPSSALGLLKLTMGKPWLAMDMVTADAPVPRPCATVNTVGYPKQNVACNAQLAPMGASVRVEETADTMRTQPSLNVIAALGSRVQHVVR